MSLFNFEPGELRETYRAQEWVHIPGGATAEFLQHLQEYCNQRAAEEALSGAGIRGAKSQYLYEPARDVDLVGQLREVGTSLGGLDGRRFTLAKRHIKHYPPDADPSPVTHKDRMASQMNIGVSIDVSEGSHLVLYPNVHREVDPFLTADLRESLPVSMVMSGSESGKLQPTALPPPLPGPR